MKFLPSTNTVNVRSFQFPRIVRLWRRFFLIVQIQPHCFPDDFSFMNNSIYIRRRNKVFVEKGVENLPENYVAAEFM